MWVSLGKYILTAYCACVLCCGIWSAEHPSRIGTDFVQRTASGTIAEAGRTIAVDPRVIPYGTHVLINDHVYTAEDTGGAIKRNKIIDIFHDCHTEALIFGRQSAEIFIWEDAERKNKQAKKIYIDCSVKMKQENWVILASPKRMHVRTVVESRLKAKTKDAVTPYIFRVIRKIT